MEDGALFIGVYTFGNSNFLHQTVHPIYANFRTRYRTCRRAVGLLLMAPGAGAILGGLTLAFVTRFPRPHQLLLFPQAALLHPSYYSLSRETFRFRSSRFFSRADFRPPSSLQSPPFCKFTRTKATGTDHVSVWTNESRSWANRELSLRFGRNLDRRSINSGNLWISDY